MKLTPAEKLADDTNWTRFVAECGTAVELTEERRVRFIRQIQADALRFSAQQARNLNDGHDWPISRILDHQANQLHPLPEKSNPLDKLEIHPPNPKSPNC